MLISTSLWHLSVVLMHEMGQKENEKLELGSNSVLCHNFNRILSVFI